MKWVVCRVPLCDLMGLVYSVRIFPLLSTLLCVYCLLVTPKICCSPYLVLEVYDYRNEASQLL